MIVLKFGVFFTVPLHKSGEEVKNTPFFLMLYCNIFLCYALIGKDFPQ